MGLNRRLYASLHVCSNATDFSSGLAWGQLTTLTGKIATGSLLAMIGPTEAFCGALGGMGVLLGVGVVAVARGSKVAALLSFIAFKLMKSTVWTALALLAKASFGPHLVARMWPILTTSSRAVSYRIDASFSPLANSARHR